MHMLDINMILLLILIPWEGEGSLNLTKFAKYGFSHDHNMWVGLAEMVANVANRTNCLVCSLGPDDSEGGMPLLPIPLDAIGMVSEMPHQTEIQNFPGWNSTKPLRVIPVQGEFCVHKSSDAADSTMIGSSHCHYTWDYFKNSHTWAHGTTYRTRNTLPCAPPFIHAWKVVWNITVTEKGNLTYCTVNSLPLLVFRLLYSTYQKPQTRWLWWICGEWAYKKLPSKWSGTCFLGWVLPPMWIMPTSSAKRTRRNADISRIAGGSTQSWSGTDDWPPERIIAYYDPASWNPGELIQGARDPIYNLNRIIRLQAVVELVTNATAQSLRLIAQQLDESRAAILQLKMGMDYVLARQGGLCGVLNLTGNACCFNISDNGEAIRVLATKMENIAHVPVQTWEGWDMGWLTNWLPNVTGLKGILLSCLFFLTVVIMVLCMMPCIISCFRSTISKMVSNETLPHIMALYRALPQEYDEGQAIKDTWDEGP
uniref:Envelope glycoprotein n=1 Tax=Podarcis muralis TaxID=64176 RepID=A0A670IH61_PODMU